MNMFQEITTPLYLIKFNNYTLLFYYFYLSHFYAIRIIARCRHKFQQMAMASGQSTKNDQRRNIVFKGLTQYCGRVRRFLILFDFVFVQHFGQQNVKLLLSPWALPTRMPTAHQCTSANAYSCQPDIVAAQLSSAELLFAGHKNPQDKYFAKRRQMQRDATCPTWRMRNANTIANRRGPGGKCAKDADDAFNINLYT